MSVGFKLWVFFLAGAAILGAVWFLWSRLVGFPRHDPTTSRSQELVPNASSEMLSLQSELQHDHHSTD
jgi:hypothetical protein